MMYLVLFIFGSRRNEKLWNCTLVYGYKLHVEIVRGLFSSAAYVTLPLLQD